MIVHGDAYELLRAVADRSIDAIITDPPYGTTKLAWDKGLDWPRLWPEFARVLKPGGNVLVFASQPFTTDLIVSNRDWYRYEIVWKKTTATRFLDAKRRPLLSHETIQVFGPGRGFYAPQMEFVGNRGKNATRRHMAGPHWNKDKPGQVYVDNGWRYPKSVVEFAKTNRHRKLSPTEKPVPLLRWLIRSYAPEGGHVLDPFAGSGSCGEAAAEEGRTFAGFEIDAQQVVLANGRLPASPRRASTRHRTADEA